jgi:hypothetical protein
MGKLLNIYSEEAYIYQTPQEDVYSPIRALVGIADARAGLDRQDTGFRFAPNRKQLDLRELLFIFRMSAASEPRDKVYSLLGLLDPATDAAAPPADMIVPDYQKPIERVYLEAAWFQLRGVRHLDLLGHVQEASRTRLEGLPSWVPDYSVTCFPNPITETRVANSDERPGGECPYSACGNLLFEKLLPKEPSPKLTLRGLFYDVVGDTGVVGEELELSDTVHLIATLPHLFWNDVFAEAGSHEREANLGRAILDIRGGYLLGAESEVISKLLRRP